MNITETCSCGASITVGDIERDRRLAYQHDRAETAIREWRRKHKHPRQPVSVTVEPMEGEGS